MNIAKFENDPDVLTLRERFQINKLAFRKTQEIHSSLKEQLEDLPKPEIHILKEYLDYNKEFFNSQKLDVLLSIQQIIKHLNTQQANLDSLVEAWAQRKFHFAEPSIKFADQLDVPNRISKVFPRACRLVVKKGCDISGEFLTEGLGVDFCTASHIEALLYVKGVLGEIKDDHTRPVLINKGDLQFRYIIPLDEEKDELYNQLRADLNKTATINNQNGLDSVSIDDLVKEYELLIDGFQNLNSITALSVLMADALLNNDLLLYTELYTRLDELGIFESNWERKLDASLVAANNKLTLLNESIVGLGFQLSSMKMEITTAIRDLGQEMSDSMNHLNLSIMETNDSLSVKIADLNETVTTGVKDLNSEIRAVRNVVGLNTLLSVYNSYQYYNITKK